MDPQVGLKMLEVCQKMMERMDRLEAASHTKKEDLSESSDGKNRSVDRLPDTSVAVPRFAGGDVTESEMWLAQLEMTMEAGGWSDSYTKGILLTKLVGAARFWHQNHMAEWTTFPEWKLRFKRKYMPEEDRRKMLESFLACRQLRGESLE